MKKYKAIAVPVSFIDGKPRFLTVRDWRFKDLMIEKNSD